MKTVMKRISFALSTILSCVLVFSEAATSQSGQIFKLNFLKDPRVQQALEMTPQQVEAVFHWDQVVEQRIAEMAREQDAALARIPPYDPNIGRYIGENAQRLIDSRVELNSLAVSKILSLAQQRLLDQIIATGQLPMVRPRAGNEFPPPPNIPRAITKPASSYSDRVELPSMRLRTEIIGSLLSADIPENWKKVASEQEVVFAPTGAFGNRGITRGIILGTPRTKSVNLTLAAKDLVKMLLANNSYLRPQGVAGKSRMGKQNAIMSSLAGTSPITGRSEAVAVHATMLKGNNLLYIITVSPKDEAVVYNKAFRAILNSLLISDQSQERQAASPSWKTFVAREHCFSLLMPGTPQLLHTEVLKHKCGDPMPHYFWGLTASDGSEYGVMYTDRPERESGAFDLVEGQVNSISGELVKTEKVSFQGNPAILSIHKRENGRFVFAMHIMFDFRLFEIYLDAPAYDKGLKDTQKYHNSFKWILSALWE